MRSGIGRTLLKYFWYLAVFALLVGAYYIANPDAFARLPNGHDPDVLGDWYETRRGSFRKYTFFDNGTGEIRSAGREPRKFWWGTEDDQLQMKMQSFGGWVAPTYTFWFDGPTNIAIKENDGAYVMRLGRDAPESAKVQ